MCGIAGIVSQSQIATEAVTHMLRLQAHRGPDDEGLWQNAAKTVVLGHRRLTVIDRTTAGHQPMFDPVHQLVITFNGEIYNYREVRAILQQLGHQFETQSDTEVILKAYVVWGSDCVKQFNGMFAFMIYDLKAARCFMARDRFGEKPFLFVQKTGFFAFASEYRALLSLAAVSNEFSTGRFLGFLWESQGFIDNDRQTLFDDIQQLLPGESAILDCRSLQLTCWRYWDITRFDTQPLSFEEACQTFRGLFEDAVKLRLRSDVPVGSCLSGGMDSSTIVSVVRELLGEGAEYHVFTGRFPNTASDEWRYASEVIREKRVVSHVVAPSAEGFLEDIEQFIGHNELPVGSTSQYAQWKVFELAKQVGVTVLLDGQGADELLGGYEQYFVGYCRDVMRSRGFLGGLQARRDIALRYPAAFLSWFQRLKRDVPWYLKRYLSQRFGRGSDFVLGLQPEYRLAVLGVSGKAQSVCDSALKNALYQDSFQKSLSTLLRYGDRNSMAHSREVRLPFCDHRLAEFIFQLPVEYLMGNQQTKRLLRESFADILPQRIHQRWNKQGFLPPQLLWMQGALGDRMAEVFHSSAFAERGYWDVAWWRRAFQRMQQGDTSLGWVLWKAFVGELWMTHFHQKLQTTKYHHSVDLAC